MTTSSPNLHPAGDPPQPDYLAGAVLNGLARPPHPKLSWPLLRTAILGAASFGLLPILVWQVRFRDYITFEQQQLWHLADWLRLKSKSPDAARLRQDADNLHFRFDLRLLATLCVALVAVVFFSQLVNIPSHYRGAYLLNSTYRFHDRFGYNASVFHYYLPGKLFLIWNVALGAAYVCHLLQIQRHATALRQFVARFNTVAAAEGLAPVQFDPPGLGLRPLWIVAAVIFCVAGAFWAAPMMLAGAAQRRMVRVTGAATRAQLAHRLRALLLARQPNANVPLPVYLRRLCPNPLCRAPILDSAAFCPRCGTRLSPLPPHAGKEA